MQTFPHLRSAGADQRLAAVLARDRRADGQFVYAVTSTGIFCRPSCASRRPSAERIAFFPTPNAAREAGFRACRRCQPDSVPETNDIMQRICRYIDARPDDAPSLSELAQAFGLSRHHLARAFKSAVGMTPKVYADLRRVERFKQRLRDGDSVTGALYSAGYGSSSRLYERGRRFMGMTPSDYRKQGRGTSVSFTIVDTSLGKLLVAATSHGICSVSLGDSEASLESALRREYGAADVARDDAALAPAVSSIVHHIEEGTPLAHLATDVQATAFRRAVWKALTAIPYGETRTYGQIASAIGHPAAARAVAQACAKNDVALIIPCHRVVPKLGGTGDYRWGAARKRRLLEREQRLAEKISR